VTFVPVLLVSLALVIVNGIFVAAEFAFLAAPRPALEQRAAKGERFARRVIQLLASSALQDRYIATAQLGITIASLGLGMYGEHALAALLEPYLPSIGAIGHGALAGALAIGALTLAHIVLGEMVPKGLALQHPEGVARFTAVPMRLTLIGLYPLVKLSSSAAALFLQVIGIKRQANVHERVYTPEELQIIVAESQHGGALRGESARILHELFEFGDLTASQVMVPRVRVVGLPVGAASDDLRRTVAEQRHTRYPVYDGDLDHIVGMLHVKDLLRRLLASEGVTASDLRRLPFVPETATLDDVLAAMQRSQTHMTVVVDEHGGTAGIVTLEDLFEEVVGEIDEGVPSSPPIASNPDGSVRVAGTLRLDELGRYFHLDLEHDEVESVSGLILARLGRPPVVDDIVEYDRIRLQVTSVSGRGVKEARAWLL
jgi:CBS domain containing-hemolysin-like protein